MSDTPPEQGAPPSVFATVKWLIPETMTPQYATNFTIQRMQHEYLISFFQIVPPLLIGDPAQVLEQLKQNNVLDAKCIFQVVIAQERLSELAGLLEAGATLQPAVVSGPVKPPTSSESESAE